MDGTDHDMTAGAETNMVGRWRKSRHSGASGNCVGLSRLELARVELAASTEANPATGNTAIAVRDSCRPNGPALRFSPETIRLFLADITHGAFAGPPGRSAEPVRPPRMINGILGQMTDSIAALTARGFQFAETRDARGNVVAVSGARSHAGVIDIVQLFGEHDADAVRIPGSEANIFFPRNVLWRVTGRPETVLAGILGLADPVATQDLPAPRPHRRSWVSELSYRRV